MDAKMKKLLMLFVMGILMLGLTSASTVARSFSSSTLNSGQTLSVTLTVDVTGSDTFYAIDELIPTGWVLTNNGGGDTSQSGHLKWIVLSSASDTSYTYQLTAPATTGIHTFSGTYGFDDGIIHDISGSTQVTVTSSSSPTIKVNEFESNPASGNEWIELYNPNAFSVDVSGWKLYDGLSSPSLIFTIPSSTSISANSYYVAELISVNLNNANEFVTLKDSSDTQIDETPTMADNDGNDNTWQRIPDGSTAWQFTSSTRGIANSVGNNTNSTGLTSDDLMVNYARGKILLDGIPAPAGTSYTLEVTSGNNVGAFYTGTVDDSKIPTSIRGSGYFDTGDNINFSTGSAFRIFITLNTNCNNNSVFSNGGNGDFNDGGLISVSCSSETNNPPHLEPISDIQIEEDSGFIDSIPLNATDSDGYIVSYAISQENASRVDCSISDRMFGVRPAANWSGVGINAAICTIRVTDDDGATDSYTVRINVTNVNDAPYITSYSPSNIPILTENGIQNFSISWFDIDSAPAQVLVKWYVNDSFQALGNSFVFNAPGAGIYEIKVIVNDSQYAVQKVWNARASNIPIADTFNGNTTNFTGMNDSDLENVYLVLERVGIGKIEFLEPVDLRDVVDFDSYANIIQFAAGIDTNHYPSLGNKLARITLYALPNSGTPTIYYNSGYIFSGGSLCPGTLCENIDYVNHNLRFNVTSFSAFIVGPQPTCSQQSGFICSSSQICPGNILSASDTNSCCSVQCIQRPINLTDAPRCDAPSNNLELTIKNPDKGDDFDIGDKIAVELKLKNNLDSTSRINVESHLYDINEDESIDSEDDSVRINDGDSETVEFELQIPSDADEGNDFVIYAYAENSDRECTSKYIDISVNRPDDALEITRFEVIPSDAQKGDSVEFNVRVKNVGSDAQDDVVIRIFNSALGISLRSEPFDLEENGEDDTAIKTLTFRIPSDVQAGEYAVTAEVLFNGDKVSDEEVLFISDGASTSSTSTTGTTFPQGDGSVTYIYQNGLLYGINSTGGLVLGPVSTTTYTQPVPSSTSTITGNVVSQQQPQKDYSINFTFGAENYLNDPLVIIMLWALSIVLAVGSVVLFITLIVYLAKR